MEPVVIRTDRLVLRVPALADVDAITRACQDPRTQHWVPLPVPYSREHAVGYVTDYVDGGWASGTRCTWALEHEGQFSGVIGVDAIAAGAAIIGYWMAPEARGRGLLTEAGRAVVDFAFRPAPGGLGLLRLGWNAYAGNAASAAVARRLGFRFEGTARLGAHHRDGRVDDWTAGLLATDTRAPQPWPADVLPQV